MKDPAELLKLHLKHYHMSTDQFKKRTSMLQIPKEIYQKYDEMSDRFEHIVPRDELSIACHLTKSKYKDDNIEPRCKLSMDVTAFRLQSIFQMLRNKNVCFRFGGVPDIKHAELIFYVPNN